MDKSNVKHTRLMQPDHSWKERWHAAIAKNKQTDFTFAELLNDIRVWINLTANSCMLLEALGQLLSPNTMMSFIIIALLLSSSFCLFFEVFIFDNAQQIQMPNKCFCCSIAHYKKKYACEINKIMTIASFLLLLCNCYCGWWW